MISILDVDKITICPFYNFHNEYFIGIFTLDLKNKSAYWINDNTSDLKRFIQKGLESDDELYKKLTKNLSEEIYILKDNEIAEFKEKLVKIGFLDHLYDMKENFIKNFDFSKSEEYMKESMVNNLNSIHFIRKFIVDVYSGDDSDIFFLNFDIPSSFKDFALAIKKIVGFDVLNIEDESWVDSINYYIKNDGIYSKETNKKLEVKTFKYHYRSTQMFGDSDVLIDFKNNRITFDGFGSNSKINSHKVTDEQLTKMMKSMTDNNVYKWMEKSSWTNFTRNDPSCIYDGYTWYIEIEFTNESIYHLELDNGHPDTYFNFGEDLKQLWDKDILRINDCIPLNDIS